MSLGMWADTTADIARARIDEIAALGATDVAIVVAWSQRDVHSVRVARGAVTVADDVLAAALDHAAARGLRVTLFPILVLERTAPGQWRGTLAPRDVDAWWTSYEAFIVAHARLAAAHGTAALVIGSELGSTEGWRDRWYHLISRVEKLYDGALLYSANWDHFEHVSFAARLDALGVTGYFELTRDRDASVDALAAAWAKPRAALLAAAKRRGLPLWLTEVGYPSVDGGATAPWDYTRDAPVDVEEQRRAFAALARAWGGQPLEGLFVWEWSGAGGPRDRGYTPRDKPAECVLRAWFGGY
ncbi:MAG: hypothetical protein K8M05_31690 [Deltaproteobacteria bacterium]|nr:hypothetical protein [Kofleriaceae bacterium]